MWTAQRRENLGSAPVRRSEWRTARGTRFDCPREPRPHPAAAIAQISRGCCQLQLLAPSVARRYLHKTLPNAAP
eukprot:732879-Rhodomonas_salina.1